MPNLSGELDVQTHHTQHLSLIRHVLDRLGLYEVIAEHLPQDPRSRIGDADCVVAMILNILSGRVALYKLADWFRDFDTDALLGADKPADALTDDRLGRALDHLHDFGTDQLLSLIVTRWLADHDLGPSWNVRLDATTLKLCGAYEGDRHGLDITVPVPKRGHSKDRRPDLKQLVYGLAMVGQVSIPMAATCHDGNASDKEVNNKHIELLASSLPPEDEITLVADSKLVDGETLGHLLDEEFHFISRLPRTYGMHQRLLDRLWQSSTPAPVVGEVPGTRVHPGPRLVTGVSFDEDFKVTMPRDGDATVPLRFLVVQSPRLAEKLATTLPRKVNKDREKLDRALRVAAKRSFGCAEDAETVAARLRASATFHTVEITVEAREVEGKRPRGRPRKDASVATTTAYVLEMSEPEVDEERVKRAKFDQSHFVLITDHLERSAWSDADLFKTYRNQYEIEGHTGFRWLKGPAAVAPMFLKLPHRMNAMGLIFVLALMVRNYVQWMVRTACETTELTVEYYGDKAPTKKPSAEVIWHLFRTVRCQVVRLDGHQRRLVSGVSENAEAVLRLFGLRPEDLISPRHHGVCWLPGD